MQNLLKVGNRFYYRRRIPQKLLPYFSVQTEIRFSLFTTSRHSAISLLGIIAPRVNEMFALWRLIIKTKEEIEMTDEELESRINLILNQDVNYSQGWQGGAQGFQGLGVQGFQGPSASFLDRVQPRQWSGPGRVLRQPHPRRRVLLHGRRRALASIRAPGRARPGCR